MFYTYSEAEIRIPAVLTSDGQHTWSWVELSLHIPIYFLSAMVETEDGHFMRNFLFCHLRDVLHLIQTSKHATSDVELRLLSPGYMNGSKSYQLQKIDEVWENLENDVQLFVMSDGSRLQFPPNSNCMKEQEMALVIKM